VATVKNLADGFQREVALGNLVSELRESPTLNGYNQPIVDHD
jgi:hypothetical protein